MEAARRAIVRRRGNVLPDGVAVVWLVGAAVAFLAPALSHGAALGPYDLLHALSLTHTAHPHVHNAVDSDEIQEFIPWQVLAWRQVHAGQLPLWDPFNLLGMPYGFNFESAPFGLTTAIGYAFPLALAHTATVAARLVLAGTGCYVCARVLRLGPLPAALGATVFELSGAFTVWDGTFRAGAYCFAGWMLAASVVLLRGPRRLIPGLCLTLGLAAVLTAGDPQVDLLLLAFLAVFVAVVSVVRVHRGRATDHSLTRHLAGRSVLDHGLAVLGACALAAPAYLPSAQLLARSARSSGPYVTALPPVELTHLLFAGYDGVATATASQLGSANVYNAAVYVGAIALVLALCALAWWRRSPEVVALATCTVLALVVLFAPPVVTAMRHLPELKVFSIDFATTLLDFGLAMLCAFGAAALGSGRLGGEPSSEAQRPPLAASGNAGTGQPAPRGRSRTASPTPQAVRGLALRLFCAGTVLLGALVAALGIRLWLGEAGLTGIQAHVRTASFLWPSISIATCAVVAGAMVWARRRAAADGVGGRRHWAPTAAVAVLLLVETAFLIASGAWTGSSTPAPLAVPRAVATIEHAAGPGLVGIGSCVENAFPGLGVLPDANIIYGLDELTEYDPILPTSYYASYGKLAHTSGKPLVPHVLCPAVTSTRIARFYGVSSVLEPAGSRGPAGTSLVASAGGESLYAVPDAGRATVVPLGRARGGAIAVAGGPAQQVVPSSFTGSRTLAVHVRTKTPSLLILRVTDVPGWHATMDGRPLALRSYGGVLMAATVPAGHHLVVLSYWPPLFRDGLLAAGVAAVAVLGLLVVACVRRGRRRNGRRSSDHAGTPAPVTGASDVPAHADG